VFALGWVFGILLLLLGYEYKGEDSNDEEYEALLQEEIEEMIATMNDQGPNN
jgi:hypothetical protein